MGVGLQRHVLEIIAKKRRRGALRTELCRMLRIESQRFHYVVNVSHPTSDLHCELKLALQGLYSSIFSF